MDDEALQHFLEHLSSEISIQKETRRLTASIVVYYRKKFGNVLHLFVARQLAYRWMRKETYNDAVDKEKLQNIIGVAFRHLQRISVLKNEFSKLFQHAFCRFQSYAACEKLYVEVTL